MKSLVPLFQILKGFISVVFLSPAHRGLAVLLAVAITCQVSFGVTIHITPKNGVPSAWELVSVEPDRIVVRKGGARFEFSRDQIERVSNPEVARLVETAQELLIEVDKHNPATFPKLETELEKVHPGLESAAKHFEWVIPELTETRDRVAQAKQDISRTLDLTGEFQEDLAAIEKMAQARSPVASNWEEVVENTFKKAKEIPFEDIRTEVVSDIESFRRTIRLSLVRRTEETENRVRDRGQSLLDRLERGEIDPGQWAVVLRDLRRQVAEQVPDADLRLELEEFLNGIEQESAEKIVIAEEKIGQRKIQSSLDEIRNLVLDTTQTEIFMTEAESLSSQIADLPDSSTKQELQETLGLYQSDHTEALAQLRRAQQPDPDPAQSPDTSSGSSEDPPAAKPDWLLIGGGAGGLGLLAFILLFFFKKKTEPRAASEIEDVKVVTPDLGPEGWAGGQQEDLAGMLGAEKKPEAVSSPPVAPAPTPSSESDDDPFGLAMEGEPTLEKSSEATGGEVTSEGAVVPPTDDLFAASEEDVEQTEAIAGPGESKPGEEEDPFGFSSVFSDEDQEQPGDSPTSDANTIEIEEPDDLFASAEDTPEFEAIEPGEDPLSVDNPEPEAEPAAPSETVSESPLDLSNSGTDEPDEEDPFGLLSTPVEPQSDDTSEEKVDDLFDSPSPPPPSSESESEEEDIFGFGNYFEDSDSDKPE